MFLLGAGQRIGIRWRKVDFQGSWLRAVTTSAAGGVVAGAGGVDVVVLDAHDQPVLGLAQKEFAAELIDGGPWMKVKSPKTGRDIVIKDVIADAFLQQIMTRAKEYDVVATLNLNGDYISDALAAEVGGIGIAPGGNINYVTGHAVFEATHGTAPKYAGLDKVNPGSVILSGELLLRHLGWNEAADAIIHAMDKVIAAKTVTYDFARMMEGAKEVKCSEFGDALIAAM